MALPAYVQDYAGAFILVGGVGFLFLKRALFRGAGQMLLGIGLVFLAMGVISSAGAAAASNRDLKLLIGVVENYPLVVFIGTAMLTVGLQSSTASIGLGIGLAQAGLLPGVTMVPWVLGANLGIAVTMMMMRIPAVVLDRRATKHPAKSRTALRGWGGSGASPRCWLVK
ncbi:MAG: Na/Pi cotransporter family protein [Verrucomicrobia bacterium]|nr:Na/Pi cotransporter family protein [Verrucomicrobiota bacterium]